MSRRKGGPAAGPSVHSWGEGGGSPEELAFRRLAEGSLEAIWIHRNNRLLFCNQVLADLFGFDSPESMVERYAVDDMIHESDRERLWDYYRMRLAGNVPPSQYDFLAKRQDGTPFWMSTKVLVTDWEGAPAVQATGLDITAYKAAQRELTLMASALEQAGDAVFLTDTDGRIRYVNAAFERITGFSRAEALGQTPRLLKSGDQSIDFYRDLWRSLLSGEVWESRYTNRRKDGSVYHTHSTHSPIRGEDGRITAFLSLQRDITEQVRFEARLQRTQRVEALGTLAGGIAHDFNNILVPILGYAEMLRRRATMDADGRKWVDIIAQAAERARGLVSRILHATRLSESSRLPMQMAPVIQQVVSFLKATVPPTVRLRQQIVTDGWMVGDPTQIHQVLMNLCVNALQAMPDGGDLSIRLDLAELHGQVCDVGPNLEGTYLQVTVTDTGHGMDDDTLAHMFEPFFTTKAVGHGTGLGLSTVLGILQSHQGGLRVKSAPGEGSRFDLYFETIPHDTRVDTVGAGEDVAGSERVLVVDDEPAIARMVGQMLSDLGYRVTTLSNPVQAAQLLSAEPYAFAALITDLTMPGLSGYDLARQLRDRNPRIPILLCTGYGDDALPSHQTAVFSTVLRKPFRSEELTSVLRRLLDAAG